MKIKLKSLIIVFLLVFVYISGCGPSVVNVVHKEAKVGMPVDEIITLLKKYSGNHIYLIRLIDKETKKECSNLKQEFDNCLKGNYDIVCKNRLPAYDKCLEKMYKPEEFVKIVNNVAAKRIDYVEYKAKIMVLFMGPGFLHNSFEINFGDDGKIKSVTEVKHWD